MRTGDKPYPEIMECDAMERIKVYICSGIFILLTILKFCVPGFAGEVQAALSPLLRSERHAEAVQALGQQLSTEKHHER